MSLPRAAPHTAAAGLPRGPRLSAVGAALSPWKAPSWGNRGARSDRVTRDRFVRSDSPRTWKTLAPYRASLSVHTGSGTRFPHFPPAHLGTWSLLERTAPWRTSGAGPLLELQEPPAYLPAPVWPARARRPKPHRLGHTMPGSKTNPVSTVTGLHTEFLTVLPSAEPSPAWSFTAPAWSSTPSAWSSHPPPAPPQRGTRRLQRGAAPSRPRYSVELGAPSVELPPTDPATAWSCAAPAWSSRQKTPPQRGAARLQRGVPGKKPRHSVELRSFSVELPPADPATAWSSAPPAWSYRQQIPLQRGAARLQRGVPGKKPRHSVELRGFSVELPPADPATAWSSAASAWSSPQQIPLQRGAQRLQHGAAANRSRYSVELRGSSVEFPAKNPATAWSSAASAWSCPRQIPLQRGARRLQRGAARPQRGVHAFRTRRTAEPSRLIRSALYTIMVHHGANSPPRWRAGDASAGAQAARLGLLRARGLRRACQDRRRKARLPRLGGPGRGRGLHLPPGPPLPAAPAYPARPETPGMNLAAPARFQPPRSVRFCRTGPGECAS